MCQTRDRPEVNVEVILFRVGLNYSLRNPDKCDSKSKMGSLNDEMRYIKVRQVIERTRERNHIANDAQKVLMRC